jgi:hypothetical protein
MNAEDILFENGSVASEGEFPRAAQKRGAEPVALRDDVPWDFAAATKVARLHPEYFRNIPPDEFDLATSVYFNKKEAQEVVSVNVVRRGKPDRFPLIRGPISRSKFTRLFPGGNLQEFSPQVAGKKTICAKSPGEAEFQTSIDMHESEEHEKEFLPWVQAVQARLVGQFLRMHERIRTNKGTYLPPPNTRAVSFARNALAGEWKSAWNYEVKPALLEKPPADLTAEEKALLACEDPVPPVPMSRVEAFLWEKCLVRMDNCRKIQDESKEAIPGTESFKLTRKMFHFPTSQEWEDMKLATEEGRPYFDRKAMAAFVGNDIVAMHAEAMFNDPMRRLFTVLRMLDATGEEIPLNECEVNDGDWVQHVFYLTFMPWCPMNFFKVGNVLDHIVFLRQRESEDRAAQARAAVKSHPIPGAVSYRNVKRARIEGAAAPVATDAVEHTE